MGSMLETGARFEFPALPGRWDDSPARRAAEPFPCGADGAAGLPDDLPDYPTPKVIWPEDGRPEAIQAFSELAQSIRRRLSSSRPAVLALTSPDDGDGKTSVLIRLAPHVARCGKSVLVVDANFDQPDLTARLNLPAGPSTDGSALIYPTNLPGLSVLPMPPGRERGRAPDGQFAARVGRSGWSNYQGGWLAELREGWPLVLLDLASLKHVEAVKLLRWCDGACLVVRVGHTAARAVADAPRTIRRAGGRLLGCVVVQ